MWEENPRKLFHGKPTQSNRGWKPNPHSAPVGFDMGSQRWKARWPPLNLYTHLNICCQHSPAWLPISSPIDNIASRLSTCAAWSRIPWLFEERPRRDIFPPTDDVSPPAPEVCWGRRAGSSLMQEVLAIWEKRSAQRACRPTVIVTEIRCYILFALGIINQVKKHHLVNRC